MLCLSCNLALPRAQVFHDWGTVSSNTWLQSIQDPDWDPRHRLLVEADEARPDPSRLTTTSPAEIVAFENEKIVIRTDAPTKGFLLLNDRWDKRWSATVNDEKTPIHRANGLFRAVSIPAGPAEIEFRYHSPRTRLVFTTFGIYSILFGILVWTIGRPDRSEIARDES